MSSARAKSEQGPHVGMKLWRVGQNNELIEVEILDETKQSWLIGPSYMRNWDEIDRPGRAHKLRKVLFPSGYLTSKDEKASQQ